MIRIKHYLHGCEDTAMDKANQLGIGEAGYEAIVNAIYEVEVEIELDEEAKKGVIVSLDGRPVLSKSATALVKAMSQWMTKAEALAKGYAVDDSCYPWVAYRDPLNPSNRVCILTDLEARLMGKL